MLFSSISLTVVIQIRCMLYLWFSDLYFWNRVVYSKGLAANLYEKEEATLQKWCLRYRVGVFVTVLAAEIFKGLFASRSWQ